MFLEDMKIRYIPLYPFFQDRGGARRHAFEVTRILRTHGHEVESLDWSAEEIDFSVLIVFGFFIHNPDIIIHCHSKGVKIVLIPLFDPMYNKFSYRLTYKIGRLFPLQNTAKIRKTILDYSDVIIANNEKEKHDIHSIFKVPLNKIIVNHVGIPGYMYEKNKSIFFDMFYKKYGIKDFVFYPSAAISKRKNQITLIKALKNTGIKLALTGCDSIDPRVKKEFEQLTENNKNILCLGSLSVDMLISAYKCAKVMACVSLAETAGAINLEAGFFGCNLVVGDNPVFREYLKDYAIYVNSRNPKSIRKGIEIALSKEKNPELSNFIYKTYSWDNYVQNLLKVIE